MAITTTGGIQTNPLVPGGYILVGDATISGTGALSLTALAASTLTVAGAGTVIDFTNLNTTAVLTNLVVTGGAQATVDALIGISLLSTFTIDSGSKLALGPAVSVAALPIIDFHGGSGALELAGSTISATLGQSIRNFGTTSSIVLDNAVFTGGTYANGALTLTGTNGTTTTLPLVSNPAFVGEYFHLVNVGGNTTVVLNTDAAGGIPACYLRGTLILTDEGEKPVETLMIGDRLVTASGAIRPLRWVGQRSYARRFVASNPAMRPVRVAAGAIGGGLPRRDLLISGAHALYMEGVLIPAQDLVNGSTVTFDDTEADVWYYHLELDTHDIILAEGAPSESYVEDDNRGVFHNAASFGELYPDRAVSPATYCAPRLSTGYEVEAARLRLNGRITKKAA